MSGNPFRRQTPRAPPSEVNFDASTWDVPSTPPPAENSKDSGRRASKGKRVRIRTPPPLSPDPATPGSPEESPYFPATDERNVRSPPPDPDTAGGPIVPPSVALANPFAAALKDPDFTGDKEALDDSRRNQETDEDKSTPLNVTGGTFKNPFERTLATIEHTNAESNHDIPDSAAQGDTTSEPKPARGQLDVDSFKRLLLTGSEGPGASGRNAETDFDTRGIVSGDVRSSIDTPSLSRSSLYESTSGPNTPETSHDEASSRTGIASGSSQSVTEARKKPPPPKSRHGKAVDQPQVVSFADFTPTDPSSRSPRPSLPKPPAPAPTTVATAPASSPSLAASSSAPHSISASSPDQTASRTNPSKPSPPPPRETRHSGRPRASSNRSDSSQMSGAASATTNLDDPTTKAPARPPPRPPPPRRGHSGRAPSIASSIASDSISQLDIPAAMNAPPTKPSSHSSSPRVAPVSGRSDMPPPPPPPRRRGSSRSSLEMQAWERRPSQESPSGYAGQSDIEEEIPEYGSGSSRGNPSQTIRPDVLADLDAFQAQVDALRRNSFRGDG